MSFFHFQDPWFILLTGLVPFVFLADSKPSFSGVAFSSLSTFNKFSTPNKWIHFFSPLIKSLSIILMILALARPQQGQKSTEIISHGVDIVLAIDTSGSMRALDFKDKDDKNIDRLTVVKDVVQDFIDQRQLDRIGMVVFGDQAFTQCPLTMDHDILDQFLDKLTIGIAGDSTAIGSAIGIAVKRLKELESKSKVIILLTDGRNNSGSLPPSQAAKIAKTFGIKIYTVGVGTRGQAPFLIDSVFGQKLIYQNVEIDEDTLKEIATITGGNYFRATDTDSLKKIYETIDKLEKSDVKWIDHSEYKELYLYFLAGGLFLLFLEILISNTLFLRTP